MLIDNALLDSVSLQARENARLRMNFNMHDSLDAKAQRLLNALQIGTVLPIHRHKNTAETYILLRGKLKVLFYDGEIKSVTESFDLDPLKGNFGVHIPANQWHTIEVLENDTVIFEVKDGPYTPLQSDDVLEVI